MYSWKLLLCSPAKLSNSNQQAAVETPNPNDSEVNFPNATWQTWETLELWQGLFEDKDIKPYSLKRCIDMILWLNIITVYISIYCIRYIFIYAACNVYIYIYIFAVCTCNIYNINPGVFCSMFVYFSPKTNWNHFHFDSSIFCLKMDGSIII